MKRFLILIALIGISSLGGQPERDVALDLLDTQIGTTKIDDLSRTMDFMTSERRFAQAEFEEKVASGLNRWAAETTLTKDGWAQDATVGDLLKEHSELVQVSQIDAVNYLNTDSYYVQQCQWIKTLTNRIVTDKQIKGFEFYRLAADDFQVDPDSDSDALIDIVSKLNGTDEKQSEQLAQTLRAFDWIVRNIQLVDDVPESEEDREEARLYESDNDWSSGIAGLGYQRHPWQTLLYSRGDYVDRAKLFILMAEELGLEAAMLTVDKDGEMMPWAVAVIIGDKKYLFDTQLGLPLPTKKIGEIGTLEMAQNDAELLPNLKLSVDESLADNTTYWVTQEQAKKVATLLLVSPESVSKRMWFLENGLTGDARLNLAQSAEKLAGKFDNAKPWDIEFKTHLYRSAIRKAVKESGFIDQLKPKLTYHFTNEAYVDSFVLYRTARTKYFNGVFETEPNTVRKNAIEMFYILMYTDETISMLATDTLVQRRQGILKDKNQSNNQFQSQLSSVQGQMRLVRRDAGFFLALTHFDNGNFVTAANWLRRMGEQEEVVRWKEGVEYLKGRSFESSNEYDRAMEVYKNDDLLQFHGNILRLRMLKELKDRS